jgi:hypothetical protein
VLTAAVIAGATVLVAFVALLGWLAKAALARADRATVAEVTTAQLRADLQLAQADAATYRQAHADQVAVTRRLEEVTRHAAQQLDEFLGRHPDVVAAHGVDVLRIAVAITGRADVPAAGAADGDRPAGGPAGLPGGDGLPAGPSDARPAGGAAPVPSPGRYMAELR